MTKYIKKHSTLFSVVAILFIVPVAMRIARINAAAVTGPPVSTNVASTMIRAGLSAEALTAVGVTSVQATSVATAFRASVVANPGLLADADADYAAAKTESDRLRRLIQSGQGGATEVTSYQAEMQKLQTAEADRQTALDTFFTAATTGLTATQVADLQTLAANRDWEVLPEFKVVNRTEQEWVDLRKALDNERVSAKLGTTPSASQQALLASLRANSKVSLASTNLSTNLTAVSSAWESAATQ